MEQLLQTWDGGHARVLDGVFVDIDPDQSMAPAGERSKVFESE
jgi:hypothetical protein